MLSFFFKGLVLLAAISIPTVFFPIENIHAQSPREPSLVGVTYTELAEWEAMYGRGRFYGGGYNPRFYGPPYIGYFCPPEQPPICNNPTLKSREGRK